MIAVTGGAGFIGSALIWALNKRKEKDIIVVDKKENKTRPNLQPLIFSDYIDCEEFLNNLKNLSISCIVHLGAISDTTFSDKELLIKNNFSYTKTLANFAIEKGIRFIYASSGATYGNSSNFSDDEALLDKLKPLSLYAYSKHMFDLFAYKNKMLDKIVGLKYFNVYGPNEYHKGNMRSKILKGYYEIKEKGKIFLFKSEDNRPLKRDFIYIKDAIDMTLFFIDNPKINGIFNIATGASHTWEELACFLSKALGNKEPNISYIDMPDEIKENYQYYTEGDISKIRKSGYKKELTSLEDGIKDYVYNYLLKEEYLC